VLKVHPAVTASTVTVPEQPDTRSPVDGELKLYSIMVGAYLLLYWSFV
jgi:hypothetical protein